MALFPESIITDLLLIATTLAALIFTYFHYAYQYWEKKDFPFLPPKIPRGNSPSLVTKNTSFGLESVEFYKQIRKYGLPFAGIYTISTPVLVVVDPDYIRDILTRDFQYFMDRPFYKNERDDPVSAHLFALDGIKWKNLRNKLTPTFTSGKMKIMFPIVAQCADNMAEAVANCAKQKADIAINEFLAGFTTDVIGTCAFGIDCNSFKDPDAEFRRMGDRVFEIEGYMHLLKLIFISKLPKLALKLGLIGTRTDCANFYIDVIKKGVRYREENNTSRQDFLQLLIDLKNSTKDSENPFTIEQMAAQSFVFFVAGFDTSSTTMSFVLYELARNPYIQERVRREILEVLERHNGQVTYDSLGEMKYLGQVVDETLRLYPPVQNIIRQCSQPYTMRDTKCVVDTGTAVLIPTIALQRDPEYYPDPDRFDPERFSPENRASRPPYHYLPFGEGPRNCIGLRFALMQTKVGLTTILRNFEVTISPKTQMPLTLNPDVFLMKSVETLYLNAERV